MPGRVLMDIDDRGVVSVTLDRPDRLNAINLEMRDQLWAYLEAVAEIGTARAVVFRGNGASFCAGADISEFGTAPGVMQARRARHDRDIWWQLLRLDTPTIAVMHGYCYGAGLELALCCDVRVAADGSLFALPEVKLGYIPSAGGTQTLPRTIPPGVAAHMILTGEPIDTEAASRWGLVDRVVKLHELDATVEDAIAAVLDAPEATMARRRHMVGG